MNSKKEDFNTTEDGLKEILSNLVKPIARIVILEIADEGNFTLGIGLPYGYIEFSKDGQPPYLAAVNETHLYSPDSYKEIEFDANGTPTPLLFKNCFLYEQIIEIIIYFFNNNTLPQFVKWENI